MADSYADSIFNLKFRLNSLEITKAQIAVNALNDGHLNGDGRAFIDITTEGLKLTVRNASSNAMAQLLLKPSSGFVCKKSSRKMINLRELLGVLIYACHCADDYPLTVFQRSNSLHLLSFKIESPNVNEMSVKLHERTAVNFHFPAAASSCEAVLDTSILQKLIEELEPRQATTAAFPRVSIILRERHFMSIDLLPLETKEESFNFRNVVDETSYPGKTYRVVVKLIHLSFLSKASELAQKCRLGLQIDPSNKVLLEFSLNDAGSLMLILEASKLKVEDMMVQEPLLGAKGIGGASKFVTYQGWCGWSDSAIRRSDGGDDVANTLFPKKSRGS